MKFVILTGMSGAGKTQALRKLEDMEFFCVDNLPQEMLPAIIRFCDKGKIENAAVVIDSRTKESLENLVPMLQCLKEEGKKFDILYLDAQDASLVRRFKATHRAHPIKNVDLIQGIGIERKVLHGIKEMASHVIDTSSLSYIQLHEIIEQVYGETGFEDNDILIFVTTFGFKRGIPLDADLVFDVRFLPNPFYVEALKPYSGESEVIQKYIFEFPEANEFLEKVYDMVEFVASVNKKRGKDQLKVAIGCTGGMHRSVAIAEHLYSKLTADDQHVIIHHRDMGKDGVPKK